MAALDTARPVYYLIRNPYASSGQIFLEAEDASGEFRTLNKLIVPENLYGTTQTPVYHL